MNNDQYFYLFADCIPVKGATRSVICDLGRTEIHFIPNSLYSILLETRKYTYTDLIKKLNLNKDDNKLKEYFKFLIDSELGTWVDDIEKFPEIDTKWESPSLISNAIIDVRYIIHDFDNIFRQLADLGCEDVQIRFYETASYELIDSIMGYLKSSSIKSVEFLIKYSDTVNNIKQLMLLTKKHPRISILCIHSSPNNKVVSHEDFVILDGMGRIYFIKEIIGSSKSCGQINHLSFSYESLHDFFENTKFNGCLNGKISIDENGEIRNCPSLNKSFGNVKQSSLKEVLANQKAKEYWNISKDQIESCKDCEFRYICTDCRAYIENPDNIYSKPLKCGYNPYTNEWEPWSNNPLKKKAIKYYELNHL